jgi:hypothetical protein
MKLEDIVSCDMSQAQKNNHHIISVDKNKKQKMSDSEEQRVKWWWTEVSGGASGRYCSKETDIKPGTGGSSHARNLNYLGGWDREDCSLRSAQEYSSQALISKITRAKWTGGLAQVVEWLLCKYEAPSSNPSYTHTHTEICEYIYIYMCVYRISVRQKENITAPNGWLHGQKQHITYLNIAEKAGFTGSHHK